MTPEECLSKIEPIVRDHFPDWTIEPCSRDQSHSVAFNTVIHRYGKELYGYRVVSPSGSSWCQVLFSGTVNCAMLAQNEAECKVAVRLWPEQQALREWLEQVLR